VVSTKIQERIGRKHRPTAQTKWDRSARRLGRQEGKETKKKHTRRGEQAPRSKEERKRWETSGGKVGGGASTGCM